MAPPTFPDFHSEPVGTSARLYQVHRDVLLYAVQLPDSELPAALPAPLYLFAFLERGRISYWNMTTDPEDLRRVMEAMRAGLDPRAPRPDPGDYTIRPQFNRDLAHRLHQDAMATIADRLDVSRLLEEIPEADPDVIPLRP